MKTLDGPQKADLVRGQRCVAQCEGWTHKICPMCGQEIELEGPDFCPKCVEAILD
jgi:predicted amidophosphoribosyltransferase